MAILALAAMCGGCASVTRGMTDQVQILSSRQGRRPHVDGPCLHDAVYAAVQPQGRIHRDGLEARLSYGRDAGRHPVGERGRGRFAGNVLLGGVVGMASTRRAGDA